MIHSFFGRTFQKELIRFRCFYSSKGENTNMEKDSNGVFSKKKDKNRLCSKKQQKKGKEM